MRPVTAPTCGIAVSGRLKLSNGTDWCTVEGAGDTIQVHASSLQAVESLFPKGQKGSLSHAGQFLRALRCRVDVLVRDRVLIRLGSQVGRGRLAKLFGLRDVQVRPLNLLREKLRR